MLEVTVPKLSRAHRRIAADTISIHTGVDEVSLRGSTLVFNDGRAIERFLLALGGVSASLAERIRIARGQEAEDW